MIEIQLTPEHNLFTAITIQNEELIKSINSMPDDEYLEVVKGILSKEALSVDKLMVIVAYCWKLLNTKRLDPAQTNALNAFIEQLEPIQM